MSLTGFVLNLESPDLVEPTVGALHQRFGPRPGGRQFSASPHGPPPSQPMPDFACRTLWVGQVIAQLRRLDCTLLKAFLSCVSSIHFSCAGMTRHSSPKPSCHAIKQGHERMAEGRSHEN